MPENVSAVFCNSGGITVTYTVHILIIVYKFQNYVPEMDKPYLLPTLAGKKNILFGNIGRIYDFHKR